jgi:hypothetical protein
VKLSIAGLFCFMVVAACTIAVDPCSSKDDHCQGEVVIACIEVVTPEGTIEQCTPPDAGPTEASAVSEVKPGSNIGVSNTYPCEPGSTDLDNCPPVSAPRPQ